MLGCFGHCQTSRIYKHDLTYKHKTRQKGLAVDKHFSLFGGTGEGKEKMFFDGQNPDPEFHA